MATQRSTLRRPSAWRKSIVHCAALTALVYSSCRISEFPAVAEARSSPAAAAASRLASLDTRQNTNVKARWSSGLSHVQMLQKRVYSSLLSPEVLEKDLDVVMAKIRGGASDSESEESDSEEEEYDSDEEEYDEESEEEEEEYESDTEEEEYEEESDDEAEDPIVTAATKSGLKSSLLSKSQDEVEYDEMLAPPAMQQFAVSIGVMMLSKQVDIMNPKAVRIARIAFVAYIVCMQLFLLYVGMRAKAINDRTEIAITNPLASMAQSVAGGAAGGNFVVKALADQVLSTKTTVYEYDLKTAKKMNSSLLMPMAFLYFLHFKMKQVQPLIMQTATGITNMVYSPLFQVYVLGRNLERPFKPPGNPMMDAMQAQQEGEDAAGEEVAKEEDGGDDQEEEEEETASEEDEEEATSEEEESDDEEEYDSDEE